MTYAAVAGYRPLQLDVLVPSAPAAGAPVRLVPVDGADHIFLGCPDIDAIVRLSVDYLAEALLEKNSHV